MADIKPWFNKKNLSIAILLILHIVGFLGLNSSFRPLILTLTPVNLMLSAFIIIWNTEYRNAAFKTWFLFVVCFGYLIELAGVYTGWIFGNYYYGSVLGLTLFNVPVIIGINWFIVSYGSYSILSLTSLPIPLRILLSSLLCVLLDMLIEPVAIHLGYWYWNGDIPVHNYIGWFFTGLIIQTLAHYSKPKLHSNPVSSVSFIIQVLFFSLLNVML